jgi:hypothetical protein
MQCSQSVRGFEYDRCDALPLYAVFLSPDSGERGAWSATTTRLSAMLFGQTRPLGRHVPFAATCGARRPSRLGSSLPEVRFAVKTTVASVPVPIRR